MGGMGGMGEREGRREKEREGGREGGRKLTHTSRDNSQGNLPLRGHPGFLRGPRQQTQSAEHSVPDSASPESPPGPCSIPHPCHTTGVEGEGEGEGKLEGVIFHGVPTSELYIMYVHVCTCTCMHTQYKFCK